jgi:hypothetical protein
MARAKKTAPDKKGRGGGTKKPPPAEKVTATEVVKMPGSRKLNSLLAEGRKAYQDGRALAGEFGAAVKEAAENDNLHKGAFRTIRALDRMEPEKLADWMDHFEHYCEVCGLNKRAGSVVRMDFDDDGKSEDEDAEVGASDGKVHRGAFPPPKGEAAE